MIGHVILDVVVVVLAMTPFGFILAIAIGSILDGFKEIKNRKNNKNEITVKHVEEKQYYMKLVEDKRK